MATDLDGQRLELALDAARLGTWTWDMAGRRTAWDSRLEELHGMGPGQFGGTFDDWLESIHPADRSRCLARVQAALRDPGPYSLVHRTIWPDGSVHWIECRGRVTVDADGQPTGTIGVAFDVTDREERAATLVRRVAEERAVVEVVQHAVLPKVLPTVPGARIAARYVAASGTIAIGGDWYASVPLGDGRLGIAIGDVAGHGIDAVAEMAHVRFSLRALAGLGGDPAQVLGRLGHLVRTFSPGTMITALYGVLDPATGELECAVAGQCPPVVRAPDGTTRLLTLRPGPPLGFGLGYANGVEYVEPGATLVLYTDGLVERRGEHLDCGFERLLSATASGPGDPDELCDHLLASMHTGVHTDDTAVLAVGLDEISPPPPPS